MEKIKLFLNNNWQYLAGMITTVLTILLFYADLDEIELIRILNADILYFPSVFIDVFYHGNTYSTWVVPGAPGFFPDMTFYFILMAITSGNIPVSAMLFGICQVLFISYIFSRIINLIYGFNAKVIFLYANVLLLSFVIIGLYGGTYSLTYYLLSNTYHVGPFVNALISVWLIIKYIKTNKIGYLVPFILLGIIASVSDKLYFVMLPIPLIFALLPFLFSSDKRIVIKAILAAVSQIVLGSVIFMWLAKIDFLTIRVYSTNNFSIESILNSIGAVIEQFSVYLKDDLLVLIVIVIPIISILYFIKKSVQALFKQKSWKEMSLETFFMFFSLAFMLIVFFTPILLGVYNGASKLRYNFSIYIYGLLVLSIILNEYVKKNKILKMLPIVGISLLIFIGIVKLITIDFKKGLSQYLNYYPQEAKALDEMSKKTDLKKGVATYWNSKKAHLFNKSGLKVYSCLTSGYADNWIVNNTDWFYGEPADSNDVFNFVLLYEKESPDRLVQYFGEPDTVLVHDDYKVYKYPDFVYNKATRGPKFIN